MIKKIKQLLPLTAVLLLSFWVIKPLFHPGFFPMHDDTQVARVDQMAQALKDGQFPVRWVADLGYGYGYPLFNFYAPLAYYAGAFFELLGFNALTATKAMFFLGIILSGVFMFLLAREFWGNVGGLISALFYIYAPYHAVDVYVRGAVGEFWAAAFLPLLFLGILHLFNNDGKGIIISILGFSGIILSHNLTAMMTIIFLLPLFVILFCISKHKKSFSVNSFLFIFFSLGLSAFYWLPALAEMGYTKVLGQIGGGADFRDHFVFLDQLWASPWGFGGSAPGRLDGMSFMIGKIHLLFSLVSIFVLLWLWKNQKVAKILPVGLGFAFLLIAVFMTNRLSFFIWEFLKPFAFIQYPWRFLLFCAAASSFLAASPLLLIKKTSLSIAVGSMALLALLLLNTKYFQPQYYLNVSAEDYTDKKTVQGLISKISDEYLPKNFPIPQPDEGTVGQKVIVLSGNAQIKDQQIKSHQSIFAVKAYTDAQILINTAFFPGWKLWIDGKQTEFLSPDGKIEFSITPGDHQVKLRFTDTPIRLISNLVSAICLMGTIWLMLKYRNGRD